MELQYSSVHQGGGGEMENFGQAIRRRRRELGSRSARSQSESDLKMATQFQGRIWLNSNTIPAGRHERF